LELRRGLNPGSSFPDQSNCILKELYNFRHPNGGGLTLFARELGFAMPFLILAAIYGIFSNLGSNQGGASAYTVFNGMQALPGQLHADDVQRDMLRGIGM